MKGGRTAPRNLQSSLCLCSRIACFNEGGADCPPKPVSPLGDWLSFGCFNEGGADCPPKLEQWSGSNWVAMDSASMKGGRTAPRNHYLICACPRFLIASMKGGRTAPRNF